MDIFRKNILKLSKLKGFDPLFQFEKLVTHTINYLTNCCLIFSKILQILKVAIEVFFFSLKKI